QSSVLTWVPSMALNSYLTGSPGLKTCVGSRAMEAEQINATRMAAARVIRRFMIVPFGWSLFFRFCNALKTQGASTPGVGIQLQVAQQSLFGRGWSQLVQCGLRGFGAFGARAQLNDPLIISRGRGDIVDRRISLGGCENGFRLNFLGIGNGEQAS